MALPELKNQQNQDEKNLDRIRSNVSSLPKKSSVIKMDDYKKSKPAFERTDKKSSEKTPSERVSDANKKAIETSRKEENPLVPLITSMSHSLFGIEKILKDILVVLEKQTDRLSKSMENSGGLGDSDFGDWNRKRRRQRRSPRRTGRTGRVLKAGVKGAAGLAGVLGLGYLASKLGIDEDTQTTVATGANLAGSALAARAAPVAEAGATAGSGVLGATGKAFSKILGAPLSRSTQCL